MIHSTKLLVHLSKVHKDLLNIHQKITAIRYHCFYALSSHKNSFDLMYRGENKDENSMPRFEKRGTSAISYNTKQQHIIRIRVHSHCPS